MTPKPTALEGLARKWDALSRKEDTCLSRDMELTYRGCAEALAPLIAAEREREGRLRALHDEIDVPEWATESLLYKFRAKLAAILGEEE
jgi:hypothetical protein